MKYANIIGWYGNGNTGDESYKIAFPRLFPTVNFQFLGNAPCDNCILGGGNVLDEGYVRALQSTPAKQRMILSVSANNKSPFRDLRNIDLIWVRDRASFNLLQSRDINCKWVPDLSFCLAPNRESGDQWIRQTFRERGCELYNKRVGVVLNAHLYHQQPDLLARDFLSLLKTVFDLGRLADETPASFIFFPMCVQLPFDDRITNFMIAGRCKFWRKNLIIHEHLTVQQTLDLISACDVVITSRLHSTIFSVISEVPFIDITHHDKNRNYLESVGLEKWSVSYWSFDYSKIQQLLAQMISSPMDYRSLLRNIRMEQQSRLMEEAKNVHFV